LIEVNNVFYGTANGGSYANGAVFSITKNGRIRILHRFTGKTDGEFPNGKLIEFDGALYGATFYGGDNGFGTVFKIDPSSGYRILYSFRGLKEDGGLPVGSLVDLNGTLYGATSSFGTYGSGTIFSITPSGEEHVIYNFMGLYGSRVDGEEPEAGLVAVNGTLYGTTYEGGWNRGGIIFSVTPSGEEKLLFSLGNDQPWYSSGLLAYNRGWLYGTGTFGGAHDGGGVFRFNIASGKEQLLHSFALDSTGEGRFPKAGLTEYKGKFFGTTSAGGVSDDGTVYEIAP
jgi:uncharacterized repeat protein (TIGR03803 family)